MRGPDPVELLVFQQQRHRRMIDRRAATQARVFGSSMPARAKALQQLGRASRRATAVAPKASAIRAASSASLRGGPPTGDGSPSRSRRSVVVHVGAPGQPGRGHLHRDQRPGRLGRDQHPEPARRARSTAIRASWSACTATSSSRRGPSAAGAVEERRLAVPGRRGLAGRRIRRDRRGRCRRAYAAATQRGSPQRPAWPSSSASVSSRSWQRSTRTPAAQQPGIELRGRRPDPAGPRPRPRGRRRRRPGRRPARRDRRDSRRGAARAALPHRWVPPPPPSTRC